MDYDATHELKEPLLYTGLGALMRSTPREISLVARHVAPLKLASRRRNFRTTEGEGRDIGKISWQIWTINEKD